MYDPPSSRTLFKSTETRDIKIKIVSIEHVRELETEITTRYQKGLLDPDLYDTYLASFDFACHQKLKNARSLIIVAVPQPQVQVTFYWEEAPYPVIIPPTYYSAVDNEVANLLIVDLEPQGYQLQKVRLPEKLLAVCSGLAQYGKNNISYIPNLGSFYRLVVFVSDMPSEADRWEAPTVMAQCEKCTACMKACPTGAISSERFQLCAERCLTFCNEGTRDFPNWLSPDWHNSLVGCMICQKVCPVNKAVVKWIEPGETFTENETKLILSGTSTELLPRPTIEKIKRLDLMEYYDVIGRNLKALINKSNE